jgi:hypothetical protein
VTTHNSIVTSNQHERHCIDSIPTVDLSLGNGFEFLHAHRTLRARVEVHRLRPNASTRVTGRRREYRNEPGCIRPSEVAPIELNRNIPFRIGRWCGLSSLEHHRNNDRKAHQYECDQ